MGHFYRVFDQGTSLPLCDDHICGLFRILRFPDRAGHSYASIIEKEDFEENPPKGFFRLKPDGEVRLNSAYIIKCENVVKNETGEIDRIECSIDLSSRSGSEGANRTQGEGHHPLGGRQRLLRV